MLEQRRKLPPMVNDRSLFTRAAPFYDKSDPFYHSPSQRIGSNYSPSSMHAASVLFEVFPKVTVQHATTLWFARGAVTATSSKNLHHYIH